MDEPLKNKVDEGDGGVTFFEPLSQKYKITLDDGQVIEGLTDEKGMTSLTKSQAAQDMVISLLDGE
jgi:uncharacterized protein (DUF2345 family)